MRVRGCWPQKSWNWLWGKTTERVRNLADSSRAAFAAASAPSFIGSPEWPRAHRKVCVSRMRSRFLMSARRKESGCFMASRVSTLCGERMQAATAHWVSVMMRSRASGGWKRRARKMPLSSSLVEKREPGGPQTEPERSVSSLRNAEPAHLRTVSMEPSVKRVTGTGSARSC